MFGNFGSKHLRPTCFLLVIVAASVSATSADAQGLKYGEYGPCGYGMGYYGYSNSDPCKFVGAATPAPQPAPSSPMAPAAAAEPTAATTTTTAATTTTPAPAYPPRARVKGCTRKSGQSYSPAAER
jgi:hypothetical protein